MKNTFVYSNIDKEIYIKLPPSYNTIYPNKDTNN